MDFDSTNLFEILFDGQEGLDPGQSLAAGNTGVHILLQDHPYGCLPNRPGNCPPGQLQRLPEDDPEELLQLRINPNEVYHPRSSTASPENDGDVSPSSSREPLPHNPSPTVVLEVLCDPGTLEDSNLLGNWSPPGTQPAICIASQASLGFLEGATRLNAAEVPTEQPPALFLTEEERHLLNQEGVLLHDVVHLSQAEERILKKIRRKIRNKHSAQDSRRRKKDYLDRLENRVAACSAQNQDLKKKVQQLEKHKESLLDQLRQLQGLLTQTSTKAAQTSTCLLILLVSFGLFIWPTCASFYGASQVGGENPEPSGGKDCTDGKRLYLKPADPRNINIEDLQGWMDRLHPIGDRVFLTAVEVSSAPKLLQELIPVKQICFLCRDITSVVQTSCKPMSRIINTAYFPYSAGSFCSVCQVCQNEIKYIQQMQLLPRAKISPVQFEIVNQASFQHPLASCNKLIVLDLTTATFSAAKRDITVLPHFTTFLATVVQQIAV